jgi:hypothetical protein
LRNSGAFRSEKLRNDALLGRRQLLWKRRLQRLKQQQPKQQHWLHIDW